MIKYSIIVFLLCFIQSISADFAYKYVAVNRTFLLYLDNPLTGLVVTVDTTSNPNTLSFQLAVDTDDSWITIPGSDPLTGTNIEILYNSDPTPVGVKFTSDVTNPTYSMFLYIFSETYSLQNGLSFPNATILNFYLNQPGAYSSDATSLFKMDSCTFNISSTILWSRPSQPSQGNIFLNSLSNIVVRGTSGGQLTGNIVATAPMIASDTSGGQFYSFGGNVTVNGNVRTNGTLSLEGTYVTLNGNVLGGGNAFQIKASVGAVVNGNIDLITGGSTTFTANIVKTSFTYLIVNGWIQAYSFTAAGYLVVLNGPIYVTNGASCSGAQHIQMYPSAAGSTLNRWTYYCTNQAPNFWFASGVYNGSAYIRNTQVWFGEHGMSWNSVTPSGPANVTFTNGLDLGNTATLNFNVFQALNKTDLINVGARTDLNFVNWNATLQQAGSATGPWPIIRGEVVGNFTQINRNVPNLGVYTVGYNYTCFGYNDTILYTGNVEWCKGGNVVSTCSYNWDGVSKILSFNVTVNHTITGPAQGQVKISPCTIDQAVLGLTADGNGILYDVNAGGDSSTIITVVNSEGVVTSTISGLIDLQLQVNTTGIILGATNFTKSAYLSGNGMGFAIAGNVFFSSRMDWIGNGTNTGHFIMSASNVEVNGQGTGELYITANSNGLDPQEGFSVNFQQVTLLELAKISIVSQARNYGCFLYGSTIKATLPVSTNVYMKCSATSVNVQVAALILAGQTLIDSNNGPIWLEGHQYGSAPYVYGLGVTSGTKLIGKVTMLGYMYTSTTTGIPLLLDDGFITATGDSFVQGVNHATGTWPGIIWRDNCTVNATGSGADIVFRGDAAGSLFGDVYVDNNKTWIQDFGSGNNFTFSGRFVYVGVGGTVKLGFGDLLEFQGLTSSSGKMITEGQGANITFNANVQFDTLVFNGFNDLTFKNMIVNSLQGNSGNLANFKGSVGVSSSSWKVDRVRIWSTAGGIASIPPVCTNGSSVEIQGGNYIDFGGIDWSHNNNTIYIGFVGIGSQATVSSNVDWKFGPLNNLVVQNVGLSSADLISTSSGVVVDNTTVSCASTAQSVTKAKFLQGSTLSGLFRYFLPWSGNQHGVAIVGSAAYLVYPPLKYSVAGSLATSTRPFSTVTVPTGDLEVVGPTDMIVTWTTVAPSPLDGTLTVNGVGCTQTLTTGGALPTGCTVKYIAPPPKTTEATYTYGVGIQDGFGQVWDTKSVLVTVGTPQFITSQPTSATYTESTTTWTVPTSDLIAAIPSDSTAWWSVAPTPTLDSPMTVSLVGSCSTAPGASLATPPSGCSIYFDAPRNCQTRTVSFGVELGGKGCGGACSSTYGTRTFTLTVYPTGACPSGFINAGATTSTISAGSTATVESTLGAVTQAGGTLVLWKTTGNAQPSGTVYGGPCSTSMVNSGVLNMPASCSFSYVAEPVCTPYTATFGIQVGESGGVTWGTKTVFVSVNPLTACTGSFTAPGPVQTSVSAPNTWTMPVTDAKISVQGPITASWDTAALPVASGTWSKSGICTTAVLVPGNVGLPGGCEFKYVPSVACSQYVDIFGLRVGEYGGLAWATKTWTMTVTPSVCTNTTSTTSVASTSITSVASSTSTSVASSTSTSVASTSTTRLSSISSSSMSSSSISSSSMSSSSVSSTSVSSSSVSSSSLSLSRFSSSSVSTTRVSTSIVSTSIVSTTSSLVSYTMAPGGLQGKVAVGVSVADLNDATVNGGNTILAPGSIVASKPNAVIGDMETFTSTVLNKRLLKGYILQNLVIQQVGTSYAWPLLKDGKLTSIGTAMGFSLNQLSITANLDGSVVVKFNVKPNVCNVKSQCLMTIPESQNPGVIQYRVILNVRGYADGGNGLEYQDLQQMGGFNMSGKVMTSTSMVIPTTGFTFNPTSNIAMNTLVNGNDVAQATSLPLATRIVSVQVTRISSLPISTNIIAPTPIYFKAVYDAVQDSRPLLAAQVEKMVVNRLVDEKSWIIVNNGVVTNVGKKLDFGSFITINPDGSDGVAFLWIDGDRDILGTGSFIADVTMRWYVEAHGFKRSIPLAYVELSRGSGFRLDTTTTTRTSVASTSRSKSTSVVSRSTSKSLTTTTKSWPTNYIMVTDICAPGAAYNNPRNCCCVKNGPTTKRVTKTSTITVKKGSRTTAMVKRIEEFVKKDDLRSRQAVDPQHLCGSCPLIPGKTNGKVYCCPRRVTVTRTVKTVYRTRTV